MFRITLMFRSVLWLPSSSYDGDIYRPITIVSLALPPKISINVGIQKWLFEGKKTPRLLCVFLPYGICQLLNVHAQNETQRNQAESNSYASTKLNRELVSLIMTGWKNLNPDSVRADCTNGWCSRNEGKLETDQLWQDRMIHPYSIQSLYKLI